MIEAIPGLIGLYWRRRRAINRARREACMEPPDSKKLCSSWGMSCKDCRIYKMNKLFMK